ncbi:MAG: hypothetical protein H6Q78_779, partial [Candidatus Krumholzibacteriota bacterium]|nr:hypothetical protein [Candidatus Krumholzibacteriota bacterium]
MSQGLRNILVSGLPLLIVAAFAWGPVAYALSPLQNDS